MVDGLIPSILDNLDDGVANIAVNEESRIEINTAKRPASAGHY